MEYFKLFLVVFGGLALFVIMMAVGVMMKRKPIAGSCGGLNTAMQSDDGKCLTCGTNINETSSSAIRKKLEK